MNLELSSSRRLRRVATEQIPVRCTSASDIDPEGGEKQSVDFECVSFDDKEQSVIDNAKKLKVSDAQNIKGLESSISDLKDGELPEIVSLNATINCSSSDPLIFVLDESSSTEKEVKLHFINPSGD